MRKMDKSNIAYVQFINEFKKQIAIHNLTQTKVADMLDTSETCIRNWIYFRRQMSGEFVVKAAILFNIDFSQFALEEEDG